MNNNKIIDVNKKSFISIIIMLAALMVFSIIITYIVPKGTFGTTIDEFGNEIVDYTQYISLPDSKGINIIKGIFSFVLVLFSGDGLSLIMLSLFLLTISGTFQVMSDTYGMNVIVNKIVSKFKNKKKLLVSIITLIFMMFGSFFGLFEEVLTLLPLIVMVTISIGYDGYLGFIICIVATGFGFASGLTNPFTVITASNIIGVSPMINIWYRVIVFILMYGLLLFYIFYHMKKITNNPEKSPTYNIDKKKRDITKEDIVIENEGLIARTYIIMLSVILVSIIIITSIPALRSYTVVFLIVLFLISGIVSGRIINKNFKYTFSSFIKGIIAALPTILLVLMAASIKYILEEGMIIATIANSISKLIEGRNIFIVAIIIYGIVLVLEFFISSSTAKSVFVMGILSFISIDLSKESLVLIYLFGDGFTNVLFPTSPVLLIGLSMIGMNYFTWIKRSKWLFILNTIMVIGLILLAIVIKY